MVAETFIPNPISIHALVKRATVYGIDIQQDNVISIHALVKRATFMHWLSRSIFLYFNPRPRKEGDLDGIIKAVPKILISIHALVKRATKRSFKIRLSRSISIHALVKRATVNVIKRLCAVKISIHALVKRATKAILRGRV